MPDNDYQDDQEQSEVFDETHVDDEGEGDILLDEAEQVLDVTQADGDADEDEFDEDDLDIDDQLALDGIARGAQASAAHWESKRLDDDDIEQLGYAPDQTPDPAL